MVGLMILTQMLWCRVKLTQSHRGTFWWLWYEPIASSLSSSSSRWHNHPFFLHPKSDRDVGRLRRINSEISRRKSNEDLFSDLGGDRSTRAAIHTLPHC